MPSQIVVYNLKLQIPQPYLVGQPLGTVEAELLNNLVTNKIKAEARKTIQGFQPDDSDDDPDFNKLGDNAQIVIQQKLNQFISDFKLTSGRSVPSGDPVQTRANQIALGIIEDILKNRGLTATMADKRKLAADYLASPKGEPIKLAAERWHQEQTELMSEAAEMLGL